MILSSWKDGSAQFSLSLRDVDDLLSCRVEEDGSEDGGSCPPAVFTANLFVILRKSVKRLLISMSTAPEEVRSMSISDCACSRSAPDGWIAETDSMYEFFPAGSHGMGRRPLIAG